LSSAAGVLAPLFLLFGVYIFTHGHLTPGGGFQGGVVVASALLLAFLGRTVSSVRHGLLHTLEMLAGAGYVAIGLLGVWLAAGFLDPRFLPAGEMGSLFSAGAIPVIYTLVGIKVGSELSGVLDAMRREV
jgi:multicomponent Na+:H+ antiporter subunit B